MSIHKGNGYIRNNEKLFKISYLETNPVPFKGVFSSPFKHRRKIVCIMS